MNIPKETINDTASNTDISHHLPSFASPGGYHLISRLFHFYFISFASQIQYIIYKSFLFVLIHSFLEIFKADSIFVLRRVK